ncbi:MAG: ABC transporter permease [Bacteroidetes bacterium]|nr:ABC transporter permease [Bacteroidota bacterium]MCH8523780.1 ABC transporter permease [Balneolales bacterium]
MSKFNAGRFFLGLHAWGVFAFIYAPILILIVFSFNQERINAVWTGFTLDWYRRLLTDADLLDSVYNSLVVGLTSTAIATILGTMAALAMHRYVFRGKKLFDAILYLPIVIPEIVMAVSLLTFYVFIQLTLGLVSVIIAHITFNIAFVFVIVQARLAGMGSDLENAAADLGATSWQTFRFVTLPVIAPGVISGALLAFTISWDDFMIAFFTAGVGGTTLPMRVYSMIKFGVTPEINAISTITILFTMLLILLAVRLEGIFKTAKTIGT